MRVFELLKPAGDRGSGPHGLTVAGVALDVRDLDAGLSFYRAAIGLELLRQTADAVVLGAGGVALLELRQRPELLPRDPAAAGLYHTAFLLPTRADLGRWLRHAAESGLRLDGAADHSVSEAVYLHDPEGNGIELYADRPRAEWQWQGTQVTMANDRLDMIELRALATETWAGAPAGTTVGHVHLQVGDVEEAVRFYGGRLGMDVTQRFPQAAFLSTGCYHHHVAANTWHSAGAGRRDPNRAGLAEIVLRAADPAMRPDRLDDPWGTPTRIITGHEGAFA